ncbi:hypothetical protein B296_00024558 [Ensete ventricosum]|uniref:Uncharacterized protein n=1 Tax=Ensete ventricosum TaxID=4639 RepID=A0A426XID6_ENSVE|nr:hypothetical protein B296_00024558 [Ensete ventricosum]
MSKIVDEAMEKEERADGFLSTGKSEMIETSKIDVRWAASFKHSVETTGGEASGSDCLVMEETWSSNTMVMAMVTTVETGRCRSSYREAIKTQQDNSLNYLT